MDWGRTEITGRDVVSSKSPAEVGDGSLWCYSLRMVLDDFRAGTVDLGV